MQWSWRVFSLQITLPSVCCFWAHSHFFSHVKVLSDLTCLGDHLWPHLVAPTSKWRNFAQQHFLPISQPSVLFRSWAALWCPRQSDRWPELSQFPLTSVTVAQLEATPQCASHHRLQWRVGLTESLVIMMVIFSFCCIRNSGCYNKREREREKADPLNRHWGF